MDTHYKTETKWPWQKEAFLPAFLWPYQTFFTLMAARNLKTYDVTYNYTNHQTPSPEHLIFSMHFPIEVPKLMPRHFTNFQNKCYFKLNVTHFRHQCLCSYASALDNVFFFLIR
ncbi:hypothetical protein V6Z11_A09G133100 [Gossypium hirsutum]